MPVCTLSWTSDRGFELELEAEDDEIALRLAGVPVPADGTIELRRGVQLDRLEILFKAHVDVAGEPGQIVEAVVTLVEADARLAFTAKVEDVETGEILEFASTHDVRMPSGVPESGGPRPEAASEDDLDWEDENTLEKLIVNAPETVSDLPKPTPIDLDDDDDDEPQPARKGKGLQALLNALIAVDDPGAPDHAPTEPEIDVAALLGSANRAQSPTQADQRFSANDSALGLLQLIMDRDGLELEEDHELAELIPGVVKILEMRGGPERQASALSEWLMGQPAVADLYMDDDDLAELLAQW